MKKMVMAVVHRDLTEPILRDLLDTGLTATFSDSKGGMLRQSQNKLYIAVDEDQLETVLSIIKNACKERNEAAEMPQLEEPTIMASEEMTSGDAVVFIWDLERMEKY